MTERDIESEKRHITNILCGPVGGKVFGVRKERYKGKKEGYDWPSRAGRGEWHVTRTRLTPAGSFWRDPQKQEKKKKREKKSVVLSLGDRWLSCVLVRSTWVDLMVYWIVLMPVYCWEAGGLLRWYSCCVLMPGQASRHISCITPYSLDFQPPALHY